MNYCVGVPPNVYNELMAQFDRGAKFAYSGKKDGTNRKLIRRDGRIYVDEPGDNRLVISLDSVPNAVPVSAYGQHIKQTGGLGYVYDDQGNLIGARNANGSFLPKSEFNKPV